MTRVSKSRPAADRSASRMRGCFWVKSALLVMAYMMLYGCGSTCGEIKSSLSGFDRARGRSTAPHMEMQISMSPINTYLEGIRQFIQPLQMPLPSDEGPGGEPSSLSLRLSHLSMIPSPSGALTFKLEVVAEEGVERLFTVSGEAQVPPRLDLERHALIFALEPDQLRTLALDLSPRAAASVSGLLWRQMPGSVREVTPRPLFMMASKALVEEAIEQIYPLVREGILAHLGELTRLEVALPEVPLKALEVQGVAADAVGGDRLVVHVFTDLPVSHGVSPAEVGPGEGVLVRASGEAMAALANWAMRRGHLPTRFNADGEADPEGRWQARVTWARERERPDMPPGFDLHLWRLRRGCAYVRIQSVARLALAHSAEGKRLEGAVEDGEIVEVKGEALVEAMIWLNTLWRNATAFAGSMAAETELVLGDRRWRTAVTEATLERSEIRLRLSVAAAAEHRRPTRLSAPTPEPALQEYTACAPR